ncbi:MAG TPA: hypothetical protein VJ750_00420 [Rhizomicrobium sp.]|nr:hypothetical protein [Rhizomicrobium sp.]
MTSQRPVWQSARQHLAAAAFGMAIFGLVFVYTGDSDMLVAIISGLEGSLLIYLLAQIKSVVIENENGSP